ncbi:hypothetical protein AA103196_1851 [Ameyamaea chiangmaiensis NBRC 103196]|uniref:Gluconolactonase n=1 Tax=Ameyamaea chiangmaiensis TaxID=442969 RepID=A0A850PBG0_9PROT|nr:L-dopachrome tautomerase-related protein [Ameyamaea chiangmaiensis]MBS4073884.1 gluconolactonase [Ameyamaea chiangmaiensis]NVN41424.1 gluconolactonase [Ameyamaea chiangmaiensis]GBQ68067.1 hypothetical protein AA103196_1851 [Ameyamaea chiangmaiensis NBRC 103196]
MNRSAVRHTLRLLLLGVTLITSPVVHAATLTEVAHADDTIWTTSAITPDGRLFVGATAALGGSGPALSEIHGGTVAPFRLADGTALPLTNMTGMTVADGALWVLDNGILSVSPPAQHPAPRLLRIDLSSNTVARVYTLGPDATRPGSVLSGVAVHGDTAFVGDSGAAAIIVIDLRAGSMKRFMENAPGVAAKHPIMIGGQPLHLPDGGIARPNVSMLALSPDGQWLYLQAPGGSLYRLGTPLLTDPMVTDIERQEGLTLWEMTGTLGGVATGPDGTLYFAKPERHAIDSFTVGRIPATLLADPRLTWPTGPAVGADGTVYVPVSRVDQSAAFKHAPAPAPSSVLFAIRP